MNPIAADRITPHIAAVVAHEFDGTGHRGSSGELALIAACLSVDEDLLGRMALGFPGLVEAVRTARRHGVDALEAA